MIEHLRRAGRWLWMAVIVPGWRFLGRMGLALRHLLTLLLARPFLFLTRPFHTPARWLWRLLGRMGLALRRLLTWGVWWPLLTLLYPVALLYEYGMLRPLDWLATRSLRLVVPPLQALATRVEEWLSRRWEATAPARARWKRRLRSHWRVMQARWRVRLRRPRPPKTAVQAPSIPTTPNVRRLRLATGLISLLALSLVLAFSLRERQPVRVSADNFVPRIVVVTPTPLPAGTATPTPTLEPTPWPTPDPLSEGGTLAFTQEENGNSDIYLLPVGKVEPLRLTAHAAADRNPAWSPNGREIAFASRRDGNWEIYVYNLPFAKLRRLTEAGEFNGNPSWSPDGRWIVYEAYRNQNLDIYIIKADGSEGPYRLTEHPALDMTPVWAPGGRHIAFVSWRDGNPDLFRLSLDQVSDATAVNLTNSPAVHELDPAFAPDGRFLAYARRQSGVSLMQALPLDEAANVTGPPQSLGQRGTHPVWSPDSQSLVAVYAQDGRYFLTGGSPNAWGVAPQAFAARGELSSPSWSAITLPLEMIDGWQPLEGTAVDIPLYTEARAQPPPVGEGTPTPTPGPPVQLWEAPVNAPAPYLSDKVDQSFLALRQRVLDEAGWDLLGQLDNMFTPLDAKPLPGQPIQSWNKAGRAFDLSYQDVTTFQPRVEVVREEIGAETYWRIYLRAEAQDGSQGEPLRRLPWDFRARYGEDPRFYDQGGRYKDEIPAGYYVDFTDLAADYGWERVPASDNWRTFFPGIRFWHYVKRGDLTWAEAMREIYLPEALEGVEGMP